jgi:hypothetical protein
MKWMYSFRNQLKAAFLLAFVIALVSVKNIWDKNHVSELGNSFSSVYEDRLLVESYIYSLSDHLYRKKILMESCQGADQEVNTTEQNKTIVSILKKYEKTKFTDEERMYFTKLKAHVASIIAVEATQTGDDALSTQAKADLDKQFAAAISNLHQLSAIQVMEGKLLNDNSRKIMAGSAMLTHVELVVLICVGLLIQALIFTSRSAVPKTQQHGNLN